MTATPNLSFPRLKLLELYDIFISEAAIQHMLAGGYPTHARRLYYARGPSALGDLRFQKLPHRLAEYPMCVFHAGVKQDDEPFSHF
jgi:hypothetical protein